MDYEDINWRNKINTSPQCKGRSDYFKNRCKLPKNSDIVKGDVNAEVFDRPQHFFDHHSKEKGTLMIIGSRVILNVN